MHLHFNVPMKIVTLWSKVPIQNFRLWYNYFSLNILTVVWLKWFKNLGGLPHTPLFKKFPTINSRTMVKVPNWNFWLYCDYFLSELSNSNAWRNPPRFLSRFSRIPFKSSKLELILNFQPHCDYFVLEFFV